MKSVVLWGGLWIGASFAAMPPCGVLRAGENGNSASAVEYQDDTVQLERVGIPQGSFFRTGPDGSLYYPPFSNVPIYRVFSLSKTQKTLLREIFADDLLLAECDEHPNLYKSIESIDEPIEKTSVCLNYFTIDKTHGNVYFKTNVDTTSKTPSFSIFVLNDNFKSFKHLGDAFELGDIHISPSGRFLLIENSSSHRLQAFCVDRPNPKRNNILVHLIQNDKIERNGKHSIENSFQGWLPGDKIKVTHSNKNLPSKERLSASISTKAVPAASGDLIVDLNE